MKTDSERIEIMHDKAGKIRRKDNTVHAAVYGAASFIVLVCLVGVMLMQNGPFHSIDSGQLAGTSMLDSNVGGYVLVAVIAFVAAVIITVLCIRSRDKAGKFDSRSNEEGKTETENEVL